MWHYSVVAGLRKPFFRAASRPRADLAIGAGRRDRYTSLCAGVAKLVDATDLNDLSARLETPGAELLKFGEPCQMAIPSQALRS